MSATETKTSDSTAKALHRGGKYLTFALGDEQYGLEILKVREIIGLMQITAVPRAAPHVMGVINLRGQVITVINLRQKFGMADTEKTDQTCIIVVETRKNGRTVSTGIVVDRVLEVSVIPGDRIEDPPSIGDGASSDFILGMGKLGQRVAILLDIDCVLDGDVVDGDDQAKAA